MAAVFRFRKIITLPPPPSLLRNKEPVYNAARTKIFIYFHFFDRSNRFFFPPPSRPYLFTNERRRKGKEKQIERENNKRAILHHVNKSRINNFRKIDGKSLSPRNFCPRTHRVDPPSPFSFPPSSLPFDNIYIYIKIYISLNSRGAIFFYRVISYFFQSSSISTTFLAGDEDVEDVRISPLSRYLRSRGRR